MLTVASLGSTSRQITSSIILPWRCRLSPPQAAFESCRSMPATCCRHPSPAGRLPGCLPRSTFRSGKTKSTSRRCSNLSSTELVILNSQLGRASEQDLSLVPSFRTTSAGSRTGCTRTADRAGPPARPLRSLPRRRSRDLRSLHAHASNDKLPGLQRRLPQRSIILCKSCNLLRVVGQRSLLLRMLIVTCS